MPTPNTDDTELAERINALMDLLAWFRKHDVRIHLSPTEEGWNLKLSIPKKGALKR
jgi:hypothetical protein